MKATAYEGLRPTPTRI